MVYDPYSLLHRTNAISLSFPYKRLTVMPKLYYIDSKYSTYSKSKHFLWHFSAFFYQMECLPHYDAKYVKTNLSLHIKIIFFSVLHYRNLEASAYMKLSTFHKLLSFFCSIKVFFFVTKSEQVQFRNTLNSLWLFTELKTISNYKRIFKLNTNA